MKPIVIKKGLDIPIPGVAQRIVEELKTEDEYAVKATDFVGVEPRLHVAEGDRVDAGSLLFEDKKNDAAHFVSPVKGIVTAVVRGEKRRLLSVVVKAEDEQQQPSKPYSTVDNAALTADDTEKTLIETGLWTMIKQRPFGIVPRKGDRPKAVFISLFDSTPLPVDLPFMLQGREEDFQCGIDILAKFAPKVHISSNAPVPFDIRNAETHIFKGPHPAGLTGTQIAKLSPIDKGDKVWTLNAQDVAIIGHYFRTGEYRPERLLALCGPLVEQPRYLRTITGVKINCNLQGRYISGDLLSGTTISPDGFTSASTDKISVLPEGDYYDFMGWLRPNLRKFSFSRTFLSGMLGRLNKADKGSRYQFDTGTHGSPRPLFVTGQFEKLVPLDIYPLQLIKACIIGDIELMENLGLYEVEPEDLALCEFADTSKTEIQAIIRNGLEKLRFESSEK